MCDLCSSSSSNTIFITLWAHLYLASFLWLCYPVCQPCLFPLLVYTQVCFTCIQVAFASHFLTFVFFISILPDNFLSNLSHAAIPENVKIAFCISIARADSVLFPKIQHFPGAAFVSMHVTYYPSLVFLPLRRFFFQFKKVGDRDLIEKKMAFAKSDSFSLIS